MTANSKMVSNPLNNGIGPEPRCSIWNIDPYEPGEKVAQGGDEVFKLSSNENPLGTSVAAQKAYLDRVGELNIYPDGSALSLREAISDVHNLNLNQIICGTGSDEILSLIAYAYLGPGDEAIYTEHGFVVYKTAILAAGAEPVSVKEYNYTANVDSIIKSVTSKTKVVFLANPNNPTGTYLSIEKINQLRRKLPDKVLLVLDEAYAEYVEKEDYQSGIEIVSKSNNVIMTRTFSKIYGLANLRIGWAFAPSQIIDVLNRIRGPFNVTCAAIYAATASIYDNTFLEESRIHNARCLNFLTEKISDLKLEVTPSVGNFLLIHFPEKEGLSANNAFDYLSKNGLILRKLGMYNLPNALRLSIGTDKANEAVVKHLTTFLTKGQQIQCQKNRMAA